MASDQDQLPAGAASAAVPCSLLGEAIAAEIVEVMARCTTCGAPPKELTPVARPRTVNVEMVGTLWKVRCVCMICGHFVEGKTAEAAIARWNQSAPPSGRYELPQDASDLKAANTQAERQPGAKSNPST